MKLVFASNNKNKIKEIRNQLPDTIEILSLEDIGCNIDIPETADTIEGNAKLKADFVKRHYGYDCFADDSGLEVDALNGAPGVYSARYAGEQKNDNDNIDKLLEVLQKEDNRKANFKTVICLNLHTETYYFTGIIDGQLLRERQGTEGFGYDPIFVADGMNQSFAEIDINAKNGISHRGKAVRQLVDFLLKKS
ncbi:non-canonical purine NTP diphosphatase [Myroides odoratimimus]|uniref:dITP/XTP pyrophosphatase n=1 Tax=Myroides odoratimimus CCUG 10230 TaxID=883150 RepID=A0ABN0E995_9FLAO|nr:MULTISPECIES: non-canonical purine NTP diphosphatase [Myroides]APA93109.1 non-canonical purine NTP pyrophosphatase [Myroides sp. ZB35]EHO08571.1 rdgB/HAM1 family non-canonical purine NTP pyrophosphatase [Myroides odoratimimus CCUG 10230]EKB07051.1 rdgB/HAM1 family non-canonical purine NTP pyrophosphatase [Myroides odoratimimus CCUG 3837]MCO7722226.1 non-canonical purine NTP diphosphatase [Myroides odoratimimus]MCS7473656.1 non-canonical purine NTP diphosphatase [Myroides odoratimimus]